MKVVQNELIAMSNKHQTRVAETKIVLYKLP